MSRLNPFDTEANLKATSRASPDKGQARLINFYINEINEWLCTDASNDFDSFFFESLEEKWLTWGNLTERQFESLQNIYEGWVNK